MAFIHGYFAIRFYDFRKLILSNNYKNSYNSKIVEL